MKKLLILGLSLLLLGCNTNSLDEKTRIPEGKQTSTPEIDVVTLPSNESKININLYTTETYYPVVEGVVTYQNGESDEFKNGVSVTNMDGEEDYWLYESYFTDELIKIDLENSSKIDAGEPGDDLYLESAQFKLLNTGFPVYVFRNLPEGYYFSEDSFQENGIIDGVIGIEYTNEMGQLVTFVAYRYSNFIPKGNDINESFRVIRDDITFYVWRFKEYSEVESYIEQNQNFPAEMWLSMNRGESLCTACSTFN